MTAHRLGGDPQTTKLERIDKLARLEKDTVFNNLWHVVDLSLLRECYRQLEGKKAVGIDGMTKERYGLELEDNLAGLLKRIRRGAYKPKPSRIVEIPKEDGSTRPLAIACFEDKIVQSAVSTILTKLYEPLFHPCSYGYREGMSGHQALRELMKYSNQNNDGATVEIDLRKYFNSIPHAILQELLKEKIADNQFLKLIEKLIRAPVMENGKAELTKRGCPQGSIISPILSNIYLHYVIDDWFAKIKQTHIKGRADEVRFADDMVFVFQNKEEAEKFYEVLPKRLNKYGLDLHEKKSSLLESGRKVAMRAATKGERLMTYQFLGFTCYWGKSRAGFWRLKYKSRSDRLRGKLKGLRVYLKENLAKETSVVLKRVGQVVKGWVNYHAISDNQRRVSAFIYMSRRILFRWVHRKGGNHPINWTKFSQLLKRQNFPERFKLTSMFATC